MPTGPVGRTSGPKSVSCPAERAPDGATVLQEGVAGGHPRGPQADDDPPVGPPPAAGRAGGVRAGAGVAGDRARRAGRPRRPGRRRRPRRRLRHALRPPRRPAGAVPRPRLRRQAVVPRPLPPPGRSRRACQSRPATPGRRFGRERGSWTWVPPGRGAGAGACVYLETEADSTAAPRDAGSIEVLRTSGRPAAVPAAANHGIARAGPALTAPSGRVAATARA